MTTVPGIATSGIESRVRTTAAPVAATPTPGGPPAGRQRIDSIDLVRGIVMVIMLLDHTRDFLHPTGGVWVATDLERSSPAVFLTRWITHFCAPVFVFLAGTSAWLQFARGKPKPVLARFLVTRGLWLIVLEFTVVQAAAIWGFSAGFLGVAQVIWVLGVGMVALAALIFVPVVPLAVGALLLVVGHNLLDPITPAVAPATGPGQPLPTGLDALWILLHEGGAFGLTTAGPVVFVIYPLLPWLGVIALGWCAGVFYDWAPARRRRALLAIGAAATATFLLLRALDGYGDPQPWGAQPGGALAPLAFLNTDKYPPSLLFLAMTLGPALVALALAEPRSAGGRAGPPARGALATMLITFGRVPLFFYVLQWIVAHAMGLALHALAGRSLAPFVFTAPFVQPVEELGDFGFPIWVTWLAWIAGTLLLYPACRWFAGVKARRRDWWLSYL